MNPYEGRPWLAHYAEGVPPTIDEPTQTLVDMIDDAVQPVPTTHGPRVLRRRDELPRARRADRRARPRGCGGSASAPATGSRSCCRTARSTSSPSTRCCGSARSSSSTTRSTRRPSCGTSSKTTAPASRSSGTASPTRSPSSRATSGRRTSSRVDLTRGAAVRQADGAAPADPEGQRAPAPRSRRRRGPAGSCEWERLTSRRALATRHPRPVARRHGRAAVHERHDRHAEGRRAQPPQPACQRDAGPRLGAGPRRGRGGLLRGAAALPRLRHDALPDLRDEHRRAARAVPEVRRRSSCSMRRGTRRRRSCPPCRRSTTSSCAPPSAARLAARRASASPSRAR